MKRAWVAMAAVAALGAGLAACETATPYQPVSASNQQGGGYSETKIEDDRWRVTFRGNDLTSRNTVETYMLYRAAQLTIDQGYDWFEAAQRSTDRRTEVYGGSFGPGPGWGPGWRRGWAWGPGWGPDFEVQEATRYVANVEIVMHHGQKPADDPKAFDARQVLSNLGGKIVKPS